MLECSKTIYDEVILSLKIAFETTWNKKFVWKSTLHLCRILGHAYFSYFCIYSMRMHITAFWFQFTFKDEKLSCLKITIPKWSIRLTGTGDLFASLFLAWSHIYPDNLKVLWFEF